MLKDWNSAAIVAVKDIERARRFYEETLGLTAGEDSMPQVLGFKTGDTWLIIYESETAGTNRANAVVWGVGDEIDAITADLKAKGVTFEHYPETGGMRLEGDIHVAGPMKMVWFKDPDGNVLHLNNM